MKRFSKICLDLLISVWVLSVFCSFVPAQAAGNAVMILSSLKTDYSVGDTIYINIEVKPNGEDINTVRAVLDFTGGDVILADDFNLGSVWPNLSPGQSLDNTNDMINVGGFILADSVNQDSLFGTLIFKANQVGSATINFTNDSHLISPDIIETINLSGCQGITINVGEAVVQPPVPSNNAPVFAPVANQSIQLGQSVAFTVSATDPDQNNVSLIWDIPNDALFTNVTSGTTATGSFSWTPTQTGIYNLTFEATDDDIDDPKSTTKNVTIVVSEVPQPPNHAPVFEPVAEKTANAGEILSFNVTASDPDNDNVSIKLNKLETASLDVITTGPTSTARFNWIPLNSGIYYALFEAVDDNQVNPLTANLTVRITVFGGECPPCGGGTCPVYQCQNENFQQPSVEVKEIPVISSITHPSQDKWYAINKPKFSWEIKDEGLGYYFNLDQNPSADLEASYFYSQEKFFAFSEINDGFWYFHLQVKYEDGFGPQSVYQIKIDTTPPDFFKPSIEDDNLYFSALDKYSGVAYFEMRTNDSEWQKVESPLNLSQYYGQTGEMDLRAVDNAGNAIETQINLVTKEVLSQQEQKYTLEEFTNKIEAPLIKNVDFEQIQDKLVAREYLIVNGLAAPNSFIRIYLSTEPETVFDSQADKTGKWQAKIAKELPVQKYSLYATANLNGMISAPSEKVYFTLVNKFIPTSELRLPWWLNWLIMIFIILLIFLSIKNILLRKKLEAKNNLGKKDKFKR